MQVQELLLKTLDNLTRDNFKRFKWFLKLGVLEGCEPISQAHLEDANQEEVVTKMTESYGDDLAVKVTIEILKKQSLNNLAEKLEKITSTSSSTPAGTTPVAVAPPGATMSAQAGSVIIVPVIDRSNTGSWNINVNGP